VAVLVLAGCAGLACGTASSPQASQETPVPRQVLAPAPDPPVAPLCLAAIQTTADGRARPLLCHDGAVNVLAWRFYSGLSGSLFRLGADTTQAFAEAAMCDDLDHDHATRPEEADGFKLASTYHGWTFLIDTAHDPCV
jgi:hypothetical protein